MGIDYQCECGARFAFPDSAEGKKARCRKCGRIFVVPEAEPIDLVFIAPEIEEGPTYPRAAFGANRGGFEGTDEEGMQSFWWDLVSSPVVLLYPGNLVSWLVIVGIHLVLPWLGWAGILGFIAQIILAGYLCAFYLQTVSASAGGDDDLPSVQVRDAFDDLLRPLGQFIGTWLFVLLPAIAVQLASWWWSLALPPAVVPGLYVLGAAAWPAMVLMVALIGGLGIIQPWTLARIVWAAPVAYLSICLVLAAACVLSLGPELLTGTSLSPAGSTIGEVTFSILAPCVTIMAMRAIGLYYRHYKGRLPFEAE